MTNATRQLIEALGLELAQRGDASRSVLESAIHSLKQSGWPQGNRGRALRDLLQSRRYFLCLGGDFGTRKRSDCLFDAWLSAKVRVIRSDRPSNVVDIADRRADDLSGPGVYSAAYLLTASHFAALMWRSKRALVYGSELPEPVAPPVTTQALDIYFAQSASVFAGVASKMKPRHRNRVIREWFRHFLLAKYVSPDASFPEAFIRELANVEFRAVLIGTGTWL